MKKSYSLIGGIFFGLMLSTGGVTVKAQSQNQTRTISGTITADGKPLSGVVILQEGSDQFTTSNSNGTYQLQVRSENPILLFKHPNYMQERLPVGSQTVINLSLRQAVTGIEEVILNAGYYKVKEKESTGSIAKITAKDIENQPVVNVLSAMQGRLAGVSITQNSGTPGGGYDIQIRGRNSLRTYSTGSVNANAPLYIIDGVPVPAGNDFRSGMASAILPYQDTNPLSAINPDDVQSIEVLKDADATAIYGSRGANGVVLVTTKKGSKGKTIVSYNGSYGIGRAARLPEMMSTEEYIKVRRQAFQNDNIQNIPATAYDINGRWSPDRNTNWQKYFIGNRSEQQSHQINISGGTDNTRFNLSGSHDEQTTVFPGDYGYKRNNAGISLQHQSPNRNFSVQFSSYYSTQNNVLPPTDFYRVYTTLAPNAPDLYKPDGSLNWENNTFTNPLAAATQTYSTGSKQLISNLSMDYKLMQGLMLKINSGYTDNKVNETRLFPKTFYNPSTNIGSERSAIRKGEVNNTSWIVEPQLSYDKKLGNHQIQMLLGSTFQEQRSTNQVLYASNFPSDELIENLGSAQSLIVNSTGSFTYRYQSLYGRINYNYDGKYLLNLTGRRDGSSRFGPERRYSNFAAVGGAWIFSKEKFLQSVKWLSFAKLRGSYGTAGSDLIGDYQYLDTYQTGQYGYEGVQSINPVRLYNPNFGWEETRKMEVALEAGFLDNRINVSGAYYRNRSKNQLVGIPQPGTTGFSTIQGNLNATVQNTGWEFVLDSKIFNRDNFKWSSVINFSAPRNQLIDFPNLEGSTFANTLVVGRSTTIRKLYHYIGIDPVTGIYKFEDVNKDGKLDINDRTVVKDIGLRWDGSIQNSFQYGRWKLQFLVQVINQNLTNSKSNATSLGSMGNLPVQYLDYWTPDNPNATYQKPTTLANAALTTAAVNFTNSDAVISNAWYVRLRNVSLQYDFPADLLKVMNVSVFFQGQNLATWTKFKDIDPELVLSGYTPPLQVFSFGFNIKF
ncbi:SusC/RagA family TonB-linked outer membrane protein [Epilithonimonas hispanica]|uniref:SusC/RagA family TonB-linked outer membrane protein n=1 Tax=Epilithonimonas hispanica TaxID=358687 RepID=A0A3D9CTK8_9FLAO|nr:SusC/RagA family TonB-linked outer membrane protein [Epilithonimonas hispanica]REC69125.1 SusC/RagA family TonB-linked outer membrane protein [Epilithonimonas hispanica]